MKPISLLYELERQLKILPHSSPSGFVVVPDRNDVLRWFGVIFVRSGLYTGGIFHFTIEYPDAFPSELPQFRFLTPLYHPFVAPGDGSVDISGAFDTNDVKITDALEYIKVLFCLTDEIQAGDVRILNPVAFKQLQQAKSQFEEEANQCAATASKSPNHPESELKFSRPNKEHRALHDFILTKEWTARDFDWGKYFTAS
ncbi:Ubiquitin-conjugating enzyme [Carpediemonas membranifera]|uniref:Ubiquitin-conjugating enzyme n=1 Tax=Carpediemonas membranifera TaxID=201153 RepID=A0A8J6B0F7_9EUKA|nr:Ubiquitin-conjugating enzyme [Carpediemonas membranifera]|eukprot:KAG9390269.1 Ubiquitin-conjugating enzyme [Carpediemonas membranifera]